ncbi:Uma2 family endonuclease [Candidatus Poribacteria bacterium]|nr:Uma2 family endonuclease [Candidatus Poribacteria bacterium]
MKANAEDFSVYDLLKTKPIPKGKVSFEQFLEWCDEDTWAEWVDGEIVLMSPASSRHQLIGGFLYGVLRLYIEIRHLGTLLYAPFAMHIPFVRSGREPDLLYIASEHAGRLKDTYLDGPADVVVEIVSEDSVFRDYHDKFREYARAGVPEYWLINPLEEKAQFYRLSESGRYKRIPLEKRNLFRSQGVEGFGLKVSWLWEGKLPDTYEVLQELMPELQTEVLQREIAARRQAEQRAQQAEAKAQQEAQARQQAEAELVRLRAELERLRAQ